MGLPLPRKAQKANPLSLRRSSANQSIMGPPLLSTNSRQKIVDKIMETFQRHMAPVSPDGMHDLRKIARRFEEKIYSTAMDQSDYLRKISLKMLALRNHFSGSGIPAVAANQRITRLPLRSTDFRQKIVNKIIVTLQRHMPSVSPDGMHDLRKIARLFEEKIYSTAVDQHDYLWRISKKMLSLRNHTSGTGITDVAGNSSGR